MLYSINPASARYAVVIAAASILFALLGVVFNKRMEIIFLLFWASMSFVHVGVAWPLGTGRTSTMMRLLRLVAFYAAAGGLGFLFVTKGQVALVELAVTFGWI